MPHYSKVELNTKALTSLNGPRWPEGKHNFTYSFEYPETLSADLKTGSMSLSFSRLKYSITNVIAGLIFEYLPLVADINFTSASKNELADIHFLHSKFNHSGSDETFGRAIPIISSDKLKRVVICVDESNKTAWYKNCISQEDGERNLSICIYMLLHEFMHALGWFNHIDEGSVVLGEKNDSQNVTVLSYKPFRQRILDAESVRHNPLTLMPLDALALREKYGPPRNPLSGNLTINFSPSESGYFKFPWMNKTYGVLYGLYVNYILENGFKYRLRQRVTIPEGRDLILIFSENQPMVIDVRQGSSHPTYVRAVKNYLSQFLPETDIVYLLSCHTFVRQIIVSGGGEKTIYDHAGNVEYHLNSAPTTLFFQKKSGQDIIRGFNPATHKIVKDCILSPEIIITDKDTIVKFFDDSIVLANTTTDVRNNIRCEKLLEIESECVTNQIEIKGPVETSNDFCWPEALYSAALAIVFACGYGFALAFIQQVIAAKLLENKVSKWGLMLVHEALTAAIVFASQEFSILLLLLLLLRPILTILSVAEGTINSLETTLNYGLIKTESYSSVGKIANNMINCGACMFGTWAAKRVFQWGELNSENNLKVECRL